MSSQPPAPKGAPELDALLEAFDRADAAVRALYRRLADDPDLASEYETALVELQRKRLELARQVGVAALRQWRAARDAREVSRDASVAKECAMVFRPQAVDIRAEIGLAKTDTAEVRCPAEEGGGCSKRGTRDTYATGLPSSSRSSDASI